jgi:protein-tyrosine phosphatase
LEENQGFLMSTGFCIVGILAGLVLLGYGVHLAIQRGGRKVVPIDPHALIIYPEDGGVSASRERKISLEGAYNFRDLGGYHTQDGRRLRRGQFFRSDDLSELTDADLATLQGLDLRSIIDLRSPRELKGKGDRLPAGSTYKHIRIYKREPLVEYFWAAFFQRHLLAAALGANYIELIETRAQTFGTAIRLLADLKNLPLVYHCSAGKDRTGIVCALVLSLLGVPDETIVADYSLSNLGYEHYYSEFIASGQLEGWGVPYEEFQPLFVVQPDWMRNLLQHIYEKYGSAEKYLLQKAGLNQQVLESIRKNLLA